MDQPAIDEEEAHPRFLLLTGPGPEPGLADAVAAVLGILRPAGLLFRSGTALGEDIGAVGELREVARSAEIAFLVEDDPDLAREVAADGVHLNNPAQVKAARGCLSADHLLGATAGLSRHDAMNAGENGADYIAFGDPSGPLTDDIIDLVPWWRSVTVLPCLAFAANADEVARVAAISTDFIGVASAVWDHPDGPLAGAECLTAAIQIK